MTTQNATTILGIMAQAQPTKPAATMQITTPKAGARAMDLDAPTWQDLPDGSHALYLTPQPAAQALDALKQVCAIAVSAAKTNSRDIADWREDMDRIAAIAARQGGAA